MCLTMSMEPAAEAKKTKGVRWVVLWTPKPPDCISSWAWVQDITHRDLTRDRVKFLQISGDKHGEVRQTGAGDGKGMLQHHACLKILESAPHARFLVSFFRLNGFLTPTVLPIGEPSKEA